MGVPLNFPLQITHSEVPPIYGNIHIEGAPFDNGPAPPKMVDIILWNFKYGVLYTKKVATRS